MWRDGKEGRGGEGTQAWRLLLNTLTTVLILYISLHKALYHIEVAYGVSTRLVVHRMLRRTLCDTDQCGTGGVCITHARPMLPC